MFYVHDGDTGNQESLGTRDRAEAKSLLASLNEAHRLPQLNLQIARAYLAASDPQSTKRTWEVPLPELDGSKSGTTRDRWISVLKDPAFGGIRILPILETRAERLLKVMEIGTVSTNVFLRRVHNFALDTPHRATKDLDLLGLRRGHYAKKETRRGRDRERRMQ